MCGIAGILSAISSRHAQMTSMIASLGHRGPDGNGIMSWDGRVSRLGHVSATAPIVTLGHRRLAVIDLSHFGAQPMATPDGRHWLVYNGEIYNHAELRAELEAEGVVFVSTCDTETLLYGLALHGNDFVSRLEGMFAFAWLDAQVHRLTIARDPLGIKPLYIHADGHSVAFASEIKALLTLPWVRPGVDPQGMHDYLRFGLTDHRDGTMFEGIRQLPGGTLETFAIKDGLWTSSSRRFWSLTPSSQSWENPADRCRALLSDSVRRHRIADVPVGCALSGGIDSSSILSLLRQHSGAKGDLHAVSYFADDPKVAEGPWIEMLAKAAGAKLHRVTADPVGLRRDLDDLVRTQDEPFGSTSIYAQYCVFRAARCAGLTVMLDGQGADELFAGYLSFLAPRAMSLLAQGRVLEAMAFVNAAVKGRPGWGWSLFRGVGHLMLTDFRRCLPSRTPWSRLPTWMRNGWFRQSAVSPLYPLPIAGPDRLRRTLRHSILQVSLPMLLRYEDRNSMRFSIESRVPFCTTALAAFAQGLAEEHVLEPDGTTKGVLRRAMRGMVPAGILDRRDKIGFSTPESRWMGELHPWIDEVFSGADPAALPFLDLNAARATIQRMQHGQIAYDFSAWRIVNVLRWHQLLLGGRSLA